MSRIPLIIDCDPGVDDAVALLLAFAAPDLFDLLAVTVVAGNVALDQTARNARMNSSFGSGFGAAMLTGPSNSSCSIKNSTARAKSVS